MVLLRRSQIFQQADRKITRQCKPEWKETLDSQLVFNQEEWDDAKEVITEGGTTVASQTRCATAQSRRTWPIDSLPLFQNGKPHRDHSK